MRFPILSKKQDRIKALQFKKIKRIVAYAYAHSDFYHQYYKNNGFEPSMLQNYEDINKIPIVKRIALKNTPVESILTTKDMHKIKLHTTSGSSGIPVKFYFNKKEERQKNYGVMRAYFMMGMKPTDVTVALRDPIDIRKPGIFEKLHIMAYDYYNIFDGMENIYQRICAKYKKIDILKGMPSDLMNLCYQIRKGGGVFPKVRILISDCEVLDEFSRKYIAETIGTPVLDYYASVENGCIAFQLPGSNKYFLNEDQVLVQKKEREDGLSDAIITNLRNTTFPIIRYQIGDVIDFGDGVSDLKDVSLRTINRVEGKYLDFIVLKDKTIVSPHVPKQEMTHLKGIKKFQIVQKELEKILIKIEKDVDYTDDIEDKIREAMNKAFHNLAQIQIEYDDKLSEKTGYRKFKCIQSDIAQDYISDNS